MTKKTLLAAGCSFTKDNFQDTWANYLSRVLDHELDNVGARGAGIQFIMKRVIFQCNLYHPDLAVIMLPSVDRFDWYVDSCHPMKQSAIDIASWQNGKNSSLVNVDGSLSHDQGYSLTGGEIRGDKKYWYKYYYSESSALLDYWTCVLSLQNFFKVNAIPYMFTMAYDRDHLVEQSCNINGADSTIQFLYDQLDWDRFCFYNGYKGFLSFTKDRQYKIISNHPETYSHQQFVTDIMVPTLKRFYD